MVGINMSLNQNTTVDTLSHNEETSKQENINVEVQNTTTDTLNQDEVIPKQENAKEETAAIQEANGENDKDTVKIEDDEKTSDEYHYLKKGEFSSENFKVMVKNIPKRVSFGCFRSGMKSVLGFKPKKVKYAMSSTYAFLGFQNEEEREIALTKINNKQFKGATLTCVKASPAKDPFVQNNKRKQKFGDRFNKKQKTDDVDDNRPAVERIVDVVCPFASKSYEEQLTLKQEKMQECIDRLKKQINEALRQKNEDLVKIDLLPIMKSPTLNNYRNKVEFGIGKGEDKEDNVVGFRLSSYRDGCLTVAEPTNCPNVSLTAISIAKEFQSFIRSLAYPSYNAVTHVGFWKQLSVRSFTTGDTMVVVHVNKSYLNDDDYKKVQQSLIEHFNSSERTIHVSSVYMAPEKDGQHDDTIEHLTGNEHIKEKLLGLEFRISPQAFFQVNTLCAEVLYDTVRQWSQDDNKDSCVLDVCCGTGTIGISIAHKSEQQVIGIELSKQAVEDAKYNADSNNVKNATFICGKAEDVIKDTIKTISSDNIIAILDPPRAGVQKNVVETVRRCSAIKKIIFVSCSPRQAVDNIVTFCRPQSKKCSGTPFSPTRAVPVDLFPHTPHCELIIELTR